jgi:hypothetical protein
MQWSGSTELSYTIQHRYEKLKILAWEGSCWTVSLPLLSTELKVSVEQERDNIFQWIGLVKHLHCEKEAENILCQIDKLAKSIKHLIKQFSLVNLHVTEGGFYDSYVNQHEDFCPPDTRTNLRSKIAEWAEPLDSKCIFWLNGMAGTGKSTIARTVAQTYKEKGRLGATFFFKKGEADRGNARYLMSAITKQLVMSYQQLVPSILKAIENDPNISAKSLSEQFDKLLLQPLLSLNQSEPATTMIVIDALDECEQEDDIRAILQLLPQLQESKCMRPRIFLTSRPELPIHLGFKQNNAHQDLVLHELPKRVIKHDIRLFLKTNFWKYRMNAHSPPTGLVMKLSNSWCRWLFHYLFLQPRHAALLKEGRIQKSVSRSFLNSKQLHLHLRWTKCIYQS